MTLTLPLSGPVGDRIGRLALVAWPDGAPAPPLEDLTPPGLGEAAVLLVRRLVVVADPRAVPDAVDAELGIAAATAARPARGYVDPGAEAILFADTTELLACYLLSLERPWVVPGWVWTHVAGSLPPASLTAVLRDPATPVAAVLAVLDAWRRLPEVVEGIDADVQQRVVEAVATRHDLWVREVDHPTDLTSPPAAPAGDQVPATNVGLPATWDVGRLGSSSVLARVASGAAFPESLARLVRVLLGTGSVTGTMVLDAPEDLPGMAVDAAAAAPAHVHDSEAFAPDIVAGWPAQLVSPPGEAAARAAAPVFDVPTDRLPADSVLDPAGSSLVAEPEGVTTEVGGVLYLVNCYVGLDVAAYGLADAVPWDVVEGLGRAALAPVGALHESDQLWDVLAALAGRSPGERPGPRVLGACASALSVVVSDLDLGTDEPTLAELLSVSGRVLVDRTRVDLYLPLDAVHLSVRRRALDADPGWVPALGRVVRFHFVGGS